MLLRFDYKDTLGERCKAKSKEEKLAQREDSPSRRECIALTNWRPFTSLLNTEFVCFDQLCFLSTLFIADRRSVNVSP